MAFFQQYPDDAGPEFQSRCLERLQSALTGAGYAVENLEKVKAEGSTEHYHRAGLSGTDLTVYVYDDGAEVQGPNTDRRFEWQGFDSLDELCEEFVREAVELCGRAHVEGQPRASSSSPSWGGVILTGLFFGLAGVGLALSARLLPYRVWSGVLAAACLLGLGLLVWKQRDQWGQSPKTFLKRRGLALGGLAAIGIGFLGMTLWPAGEAPGWLVVPLFGGLLAALSGSFISGGDQPEAPEAEDRGGLSLAKVAVGMLAFLAVIGVFELIW